MKCMLEPSRRWIMRAITRIGLLCLGLVAVLTPAVHAGQNVLSWTDNASNEQNFNIERKAVVFASVAAFTPLATGGFDIVTFTDTAVSEGATYCYRVNASNTAGASAFSNTAARTVPFSVPLAPPGLTVN